MLIFETIYKVTSKCDSLHSDYEEFKQLCREYNVKYHNTINKNGVLHYTCEDSNNCYFVADVCDLLNIDGGKIRNIDDKYVDLDFDNIFITFTEPRLLGLSHRKGERLKDEIKNMWYHGSESVAISDDYLLIKTRDLDFILVERTTNGYKKHEIDMLGDYFMVGKQNVEENAYVGDVHVEQQWEYGDLTISLERDFVQYYIRVIDNKIISDKNRKKIIDSAKRKDIFILRIQTDVSRKDELNRWFLENIDESEKMLTPNSKSFEEQSKDILTYLSKEDIHSLSPLISHGPINNSTITMAYALSQNMMRYFLDTIHHKIWKTFEEEENIEILYEAAHHVLPSFRYVRFLMYETYDESLFRVLNTTEIGKKNLYLNKNDLEEVLGYKLGSTVDCSEFYEMKKENKCIFIKQTIESV